MRIIRNRVGKKRKTYKLLQSAAVPWVVIVGKGPKAIFNLRQRNAEGESYTLEFDATEVAYLKDRIEAFERYAAYPEQ